MSASLVGSEMCIRDRMLRDEEDEKEGEKERGKEREKQQAEEKESIEEKGCLLYTSDAADDM
eukprot:9401762-Alexandrium_andersonii.AAC.1